MHLIHYNNFFIQNQGDEMAIEERLPDTQDHGIQNNDETAPYDEHYRSREGGQTNKNTSQKLLKSSSDYVIPAGADQESLYEEIPNSSSPVYTELNRNREDENENDKTYQKLLKRDSDYVIPNDGDGEHSYEDVEKKKSPPGYTELDQTKRVKDDDESYQKLVKK